MAEALGQAFSDKPSLLMDVQDRMTRAWVEWELWQGTLGGSLDIGEDPQSSLCVCVVLEIEPRVCSMPGECSTAEPCLNSVPVLYIWVHI